MKPNKTLLSGAQALRRRRLQRTKRAKFVELAPQGAYETLVDYSLGRLPRRVAMDALGLEAYGDLLCMLGAAGLSQPIVPGAQRAKMVEDMLRILGVVRPRRTSKAKLPMKRFRSKVLREAQPV